MKINLFLILNFRLYSLIQLSKETLPNVTITLSFFKHGKTQLLPNGLIILSSYHPSPRNVNTRLITNNMMVNLFKKAKKLAKF